MLDATGSRPPRNFAPANGCARCAAFAVLISCNAGEHDTLSPSEEVPSVADVASMQASQESAADTAHHDAGPSGNGGATSVEASDSNGESLDTVPDAGAIAVVSLEPDSIDIVSLPIGSVVYITSGYDSTTNTCISVVWDFSAGDYTLERHCDDFPKTDNPFPSVFLVHDSPEPCGDVSGGDEELFPTSGSGCIDFLSSTLNVQLEVETGGVEYRLRLEQVASSFANRR